MALDLFLIPPLALPQYFATVARGLETLAAEELTQLGAQAVTPGFCGVAFSGDRPLLYRVNLWARLPFRILLTLRTVSCPDGDRFYQSLQTIDWGDYFSPDQTIAVKVTGKNDQLNHSHFTALQVKRAIVDQQVARWGDRSNVDKDRPDVEINAHIDGDTATVSLNSSGSSLHRRGYRPAVGAAPLKESLAAAILRLADWQPDQMFYDPLCGSGTLPLEASLSGLNLAPGLFRPHFGFETWPDFEPALWQKMKQEAARQRKTTLPAPIWGSDQDPEVIAGAIANARACGVEDHVYFTDLDLHQVEPPTPQGVVICNPPYGERLGADEDLGAFYKLLGTVLKERFKGWTAFVLSGNKALSQAIGLRSAWRTPLYNGTIACQLLKYELY